MRLAQNKAEIAAEWTSAMNQFDLSRLEPLCRKDVIVHAPSPPGMASEGLDRIAAIVSCYRTAFPGGRFTLESTHREDDVVRCTWIARGVNSGHFLDFPITNGDVLLRGSWRFRVVDGLFAEIWFDFSLYDLLEQLGGLAPQPGRVAPSAAAINGAALIAWVEALSGGARDFEPIFDAHLLVHCQCFDLRFIERGRGALDKILGYLQVMVSDMRVTTQTEIGQGRTSIYRGIAERHLSGAGAAVFPFYFMCRSDEQRVVAVWIRVGGHLHGVE